MDDDGDELPGLQTDSDSSADDVDSDKVSVASADSMPELGPLSDSSDDEDADPFTTPGDRALAEARELGALRLIVAVIQKAIEVCLSASVMFPY